MPLYHHVLIHVLLWCVQVLDTFLHADQQLLHQHPELPQATVLVHFHSDIRVGPRCTARCAGHNALVVIAAQAANATIAALSAAVSLGT